MIVSLNTPQTLTCINGHRTVLAFYKLDKIIIKAILKDLILRHATQLPSC